MNEPGVDTQALLAGLPEPWPQPLLEEIRRRIQASGERLVILDDDPTGAQTSHNVPVLTAWDADLIAGELGRSSAFFLLTNSRGASPDIAEARLRIIGRSLRQAAHMAGVQPVLAFRGDSTLRGHFPLEVDALLDEVSEPGAPRPAYVIAPYFAEGGRITVDDTHYVLQGNRAVPAAETEFARDPAFGYRSSNLREWVEEKTAGRIASRDVVSVSLADLRLGGPEAVEARLRTVPPGGGGTVNATTDRDVEVFVLGLLQAEAAGQRFVYRTAASFARIRAGITTRPLLTAEETRSHGATGGLIVVGSYVRRTTAQLEEALTLDNTGAIEMSVDAVLAGGESRAAEVQRAGGDVSRVLDAGRDVILFTSRGLRSGPTAMATLTIGQEISYALCDVVSGLTTKPRYLIVKGGNTASEVAVAALGVRRALALGQLLPGVPVWQLGNESRHPGLRYVVFPGNVGDERGLADAIELMRR